MSESAARALSKAKPSVGAQSAAKQSRTSPVRSARIAQLSNGGVVAVLGAMLGINRPHATQRKIEVEGRSDVDSARANHIAAESTLDQPITSASVPIDAQGSAIAQDMSPLFAFLVSSARNPVLDDAVGVSRRAVSSYLPQQIFIPSQAGMGQWSWISRRPDGLDHLSPECMQGMCGLGRDAVATRLRDLGVPAEGIWLNQMEVISRVPASKHASGVVEFVPGKYTLFDTTFAQFTGQRTAETRAGEAVLNRSPAGRQLRADLLEKGYTVLTDEKANIYTQATARGEMKGVVGVQDLVRPEANLGRNPDIGEYDADELKLGKFLPQKAAAYRPSGRIGIMGRGFGAAYGVAGLTALPAQVIADIGKGDIAGFSLTAGMTGASFVAPSVIGGAATGGLLIGLGAVIDFHSNRDQYLRDYTANADQVSEAFGPTLGGMVYAREATMAALGNALIAGPKGYVIGSAIQAVGVQQADYTLPTNASWWQRYVHATAFSQGGE